MIFWELFVDIGSTLGVLYRYSGSFWTTLWSLEGYSKGHFWVTLVLLCGSFWVYLNFLCVLNVHFEGILGDLGGKIEVTLRELLSDSRRFLSDIFYGLSCRPLVLFIDGWTAVYS